MLSYCYCIGGINVKYNSKIVCRCRSLNRWIHKGVRGGSTALAPSVVSISGERPVSFAILHMEPVLLGWSSITFLASIVTVWIVVVVVVWRPKIPVSFEGIAICPLVVIILWWSALFFVALPIGYSLVWFGRVPTVEILATLITRRWGSTLPSLSLSVVIVSFFKFYESITEMAIRTYFRMAHRRSTRLKPSMVSRVCTSDYVV